ncbi:MAG: TatD family hydrolase [Candidatus Omnitrophota bacterium]
MLIDTHCHLDFKQFDSDRDEVIKRAEQAGVKYLINVGADMRGSEESIKLAKQYDNIFAAVGIHPHYAQQVTLEDVQHVESLANEQKVIAIGEIGLDYFDHDKPSVLIEKTLRAKQQEVLIKFINLAMRKKLPMIFHCRNASDDLLPIISENIDAADSAVVHCFAQSKEFLRACFDKGLYASFTANITYKNADKLRELIAYAPLDRIFLETDAPYLAPQQKRGKRNEPAYITFLANEIARIKQIGLEKVAQVTTDNAKSFFNIN